MNKILQTAAVALASVLTAGCASNEPKPHDWALDVQTAETREAHLALANHYEQVAKEMLKEVEEERRMLEQYQAQPHKYGKRLNDLKAHAQSLILDAERAAQESRKMAEYHRQFAAEQK